MTNETLAAHMKAYRAGTIQLKDHQDMVAELVSRNEGVLESRAEVRKRFDEMRDRFIEMLFDDD